MISDKPIERDRSALKSDVKLKERRVQRVKKEDYVLLEREILEWMFSELKAIRETLSGGRRVR